jgi:cobalt-zinc-cadmium efflux system outer membrane protein
MSHVSIARLALAALFLRSLPAFAEQVDLDLRGALDRAHRAAPEAVAARGRVAEAEAGLVGAGVAFTANPELEAGAGPRLLSGHPLDAELRIAQDLEPWRRAPRREVARAEVAHARAEGDASLRELDLEVSLAFYDALYADRTADLARRAEDLARRAAEAAVRRRRAGDITDLDANLVHIALGRARAEAQAAAIERTAAVGRIAALIGAGPADVVVLHGDLRPAPLAEPAAGLAEARADVRELDRAREVAAAEHARAIASGRPELGLWAAYQREDTAAILLGGLRMTLPIWNRAQGDRTAARAKERRAIETREATVRAASRQIADAFAAYANARETADAYERDIVPLLEDSERLLERTVEAGQIAISDYLVARQELLNGRRAHLERLLALAKAAAGARYAAGVP